MNKRFGRKTLITAALVVSGAVLVATHGAVDLASAHHFAGQVATGGHWSHTGVAGSGGHFNRN